MGIALASTAAVAFVVGSKKEEPQKVSTPPVTQPTQPAEPTNPLALKGREYLSEDATRQLYERGFQDVLRRTSESSIARNHPMTPDIRILKDFKEKLVRWATVNKDGMLIALENGLANGGWIAVRNPADADISKNTPMIKVGIRSDMNLLEIMPVPLSRAWAGILMVHELVHLHDRVTGAESPRPGKQEFLAGEIKAYGIETGVIDIMTQGKFDQKLDMLIKEFNLTTAQEVFELSQDYSAEAKRFDARLRSELDPLITPEPVQSNTERASRDGLYYISLCMRISAITNPEGWNQEMAAIMEKLFLSRSPESLPQHE